MNLGELKIKIDAAHNEQLGKELKNLSLPQKGLMPYYLLGFDLATASFSSVHVFHYGTDNYDLYYENINKLIEFMATFGYTITFDVMNCALTENRISPGAVYADLAAGKETKRVIALTEALGLPQHALIGRGIEIKGKVVEADKESVRWLPGGE